LLGIYVRHGSRICHVMQQAGDQDWHEHAGAACIAMDVQTKLALIAGTIIRRIAMVMMIVVMMIVAIMMVMAVVTVVAVVNVIIVCVRVNV
jgi:hypothetical protein